jgi:hypothetical protein
VFPLGSKAMKISYLEISKELYKQKLGEFYRSKINFELSKITPYLLTSGNCEGGDLPPTNSSKGEILCIAFKRTKLYLVVAYM